MLQEDTSGAPTSPVHLGGEQHEEETNSLQVDVIRERPSKKKDTLMHAHTTKPLMTLL